MSMVVVSDKGQVVIPAEIRRRMGITPGSRVEVSVVGDRVQIVLARRGVRTTHDSGFGMLTYRGQPHRLADFDVADAMRDTGEHDRG